MKTGALRLTLPDLSKYLSSFRTPKQRIKDKIMADALLDNRWGSDDAGFSNAIGSGLDIDGVQVGNNRSSQNPVLAAKTRTDPQVIGKKSKVGKTGKTVQPNLFYNQSVDLVREF